MFDDYARNMSRNIYDSKQEGTELKILTPKQMLQRLPVALAQIKAGTNSQSLLNEIRHIDCNWIRTHNHLVHKRTLNHLAKLAFFF